MSLAFSLPGPFDLEMARLVFGDAALAAALKEHEGGREAMSASTPTAAPSIGVVLGVIGCLLLLVAAVVGATLIAHRRGSQGASSWPVSLTAGIGSLSFAVVLAALAGGLIK